MKWRSLTLAVPGLVLLLAAQAGAQTDEQRAGARAAATAGGQAFMEKRWSDAVDLFSRAESLLHSPVHLLYTARALDKMGSLVKARETYIKIQNDDLPAGAPAPWRDAKNEAEKELDALEPRIPSVTVMVQGAGSKPVTVTMDGNNVPSALLGVPRPVDPGEHKFEARAEGLTTATSAVTMKERRNETVVLTLTPPGAAPPPPTTTQPPTPAQTSTTEPAAPAAPPPAEAPPAGAPGEADHVQHGPNPATYAALGVGVAGIAVGTIFLLQSNSSVDKADKLCNLPGGRCPLGSESKVNGFDDDARSQRTIATIGFVAGGVGLAAGGILFAVTSKKKPSASAEVHPWVGLGSAGVSGKF